MARVKLVRPKVKIRHLEPGIRPYVRPTRAFPRGQKISQPQPNNK